MTKERRKFTWPYCSREIVQNVEEGMAAGAGVEDASGVRL